ncbi:flagellar motor protein MotB [Sporolactobacillus terrae]|uniref:Chemotaxis protein MotB n=1 Tax=Sporolactobacillus terrae TaxID=269673 RepID=A0A410D771_9BACL|nr:flagellar motor protein MotB [Sporolactobacillus terrae]QAA21925.1 flagellar motor protein MotB [Sporolactobacillus terrae]QAA24898.1 flagellar motor protein MotB [Sporolactobacillus terrae]UAK16718.1 OmpA family protein [Sporolactobacillus terrae]BBN98202.1 chemotaxis protein MotB [Sporolactobacillus terrae]
MSRPNRRRRRYTRTEEPSHNSERWLVTYSDLITLLLVFFIVMYSMSSIENQKFNAIVSSLRTSFHGDSLLEGLGYPSVDKGQTKPTVPLDKEPENVSDAKKKKDNQHLDKLYVQLDQYIKENNLDPDVSLTETQRGVQLTFREKILFDLGKADLKSNAQSVLNRIGTILKSVANEISVEGYTDNTPFRDKSKGIRSNWELSGLRAQTVMNYLIDKDGLEAKRMHFVGYGEYRPIVKNDTDAHKAMNRRVNIVVIREGKSE